MLDPGGGSKMAGDHYKGCDPHRVGRGGGDGGGSGGKASNSAGEGSPTLNPVAAEDRGGARGWVPDVCRKVMAGQGFISALIP